MSDIGSSVNQGYRPLNAQEMTSIQKRRNLFYQVSDVAKFEIDGLQQNIKESLIEQVREHYENQRTYEKLRIRRMILETLNTAIEKTRPTTPNGTLVCHNCDIRGMASTGYNSQLDVEFYKCQCCGADYIVDVFPNGLMMDFR